MHGFTVGTKGLFYILGCLMILCKTTVLAILISLLHILAYNPRPQPLHILCEHPKSISIVLAEFIDVKKWYTILSFQNLIINQVELLIYMFMI